MRQSAWKFMSGTIAVLSLAMAARTAEAGEQNGEFFLPQTRMEGTHGDMVTRLSFETRIMSIDGSVESMIPMDYGDLFGTGVGFALEGTLLWEVSPDVFLGPYLSFGMDFYDGDAFTDSFGDTLKPDGMTTTNVLVGGRVHYEFSDGFFWDGSLGMGMAHYDTVDAVFTFAGNPIDVTLFDASSKFAFELGTRLGYEVDSFFFEAGFSLRFQGEPDDADFTFDTRSPAIAAFEFGAGLRF